MRDRRPALLCTFALRHDPNVFSFKPEMVMP
jgi:hypothetical protein